MRSHILPLVAVAFGLPGAAALAQGTADPVSTKGAGTVAVGSRVRILSPELPQPLVGEVLALEPGALVVGGRGGSDKRRVLLSSASSLEVSAGRKSEAARGAMIGGAIGALSGVLTNIGDYNSDNHTLAKSVVGAASGAAVGALVGWAIKTDAWQPARAPAVSAAITPVRRGAAFSVRVAWGQGRP